MATIDLWPTEIVTDSTLEGPTSLLREQAALLGKKTKYLVEAQVQTVADINSRGNFIDGFNIVSPSLNYEYRLFEVNYPLESYPALVIWEGFGASADSSVGNTPARHVNSKEALEGVLQEIFSHPKTMQVIQALISRSRS